MNYIIREMRQNEIPLLNDFLYEAIFVPEGEKTPLKSIIEQPELQVYVNKFGNNKDDICLARKLMKRL